MIQGRLKRVFLTVVCMGHTTFQLHFIKEELMEMCRGIGYIGMPCTFCSFCCASETALKNKVYFKHTHTHTQLIKVLPELA